MRGVGSGPALRALLRAGHQVQAVVMPGPPGLRTLPPTVAQRAILPMVQPEGAAEFVDEIARATAIPVLLIGSLRSPDVIAAIAAFEPAVIVASCFPWRVPAAVLRLPQWGCLNVHPSLLPRWRGPDPVAWTLRSKETMTGVTVHLMDEGFDSGPIVLQKNVAVPPGTQIAQLERELSDRGADLLIQAIAGLTSGRIVPAPQDHRRATFAPYVVDDRETAPQWQICDFKSP